MGGNAFPHLAKYMTRVRREHVLPTVRYVVDNMNIKGFDYSYAVDNLMGSAGKQETSGDLDFAINNKPARFVGQKDLPVFDLGLFAFQAKKLLGGDFVSTKTLKGGQFQTAWPVVTCYHKKETKFALHDDGKPLRIQVDFVAGNPEWLRFSHWSPGNDVSPWKGVMISTLLGVLAKLHKEYEVRDVNNSKVARVGLHYDLEQGLYRKWELRRQEGCGLSKVDPDYFESKMSNCPRLPRVGYVTNPEAVLEMLFGEKVMPMEVDTFEKLVYMTRKKFPTRFNEVWERFVEAFMGSAGRKEYDLLEVAFADVWGFENL
jgi:hypothetical protein